MSRGGAREGTGPKKGQRFKKTLQKEAMKARLRELLFKDFDEVITSQLESAKGIHIIETTTTGTILRYQKEPNAKAAQLLIEQALGKPLSEIEDGDGVIFRLNIVRNEPNTGNTDQSPQGAG